MSLPVSVRTRAPNLPGDSCVAVANNNSARSSASARPGSSVAANPAPAALRKARRCHMSVAVQSRKADAETQRLREVVAEQRIKRAGDVDERVERLDAARLS